MHMLTFPSGATNQLSHETFQHIIHVYSCGHTGWPELGELVNGKLAAITISSNTELGSQDWRAV